ncbi:MULTISPECIES: hypothetical protein [Streptomyces]|uniref:hypothetical protein n=1 Tax=Streptomyces TaxID=1883 RepID=UPI0022575753|nr:hypothetical protein [Streptomyces uncialis]MCX4659171.1 hypothetical protein [Streptomyces uncialis]
MADRPTSQDAMLEQAFGAPIHQLYVAAAGTGASAALRRALELRSFLALAEEQVVRVRDRVHQATAPGRDLGELSADALRFDAQWMEAALSARDGYVTALTGLLRSMPPSAPAAGRPVEFTQARITTALPPVAPALTRAGATGTPTAKAR